MAKNDVATPEPAKVAEKPEPESKQPEYAENDPVTVIWKEWTLAEMTRGKVTYFDRHQFVGGVGRRVPYKDAKNWQKQGHGIHIFGIKATEDDFIRATGHKPLDDEKLAQLLRTTEPGKLAALLGRESLDKLAALQQV